MNDRYLVNRTCVSPTLGGVSYINKNRLKQLVETVESVESAVAGTHPQRHLFSSGLTLSSVTLDDRPNRPHKNPYYVTRLRSSILIGSNTLVC